MLWFEVLGIIIVNVHEILIICNLANIDTFRLHITANKDRSGKIAKGTMPSDCLL